MEDTDMPRIRIRKDAILLSRADALRLDSLIDAHAANQIAIARMTTENKKLIEELEERLKEYGIKERNTSTGAKALYVTPKGKKQRIVSAQGLFERVDRDDFFTAVSVSVTKAEKLMTARELEVITTEIPAPIKDPVLTVLPPEA